MTLLLLLACTQSTTGARAWRMESLDEGVGGPKAMAQPGDFRMENEHLTVAVLNARYSLGPSPYGGTIADLDKVRADPEWGANHGNDQFAEMFPSANLDIPKADTEGQVSILNDGSDGNAAVIRVDVPNAALLTLLDVLWTVVDQPDFRMTTDYILEPDAEVLKIRTQVSFVDTTATLPEGVVLEGAEDGLDLLDLAISSGLTFGDFYLQGGSVDVFAPGLGFDEDMAVEDAAQAGRNLFSDPFNVPFLGGTGDDVSYGMAAATGNLYVPLFTSSQTAAFGAGVVGDGSSERFPAGASYVYERYLAVGDGDMGSVYDALARARGDEVGEVRGYVVEDGTGVPVSGATVLAYEPGAAKAWNQWESDVGEDTQADGDFGGSLPPGSWELEVHKRGRPVGPRVPVTVTAGQTTQVVLGSPRPGEVRVRVVDGGGRPMPAKVTFTGTNGTTGSLSSDAGEPYIGGSPAEVQFAPYGEVVTVLPPGTYTATATRGLEYEIASQDVTVRADGASDLTLVLDRSIDTTGWVSADFHVHAANSFDSGVGLGDRVVTMVCEGVEFFTSSDHDYVTDFAPVVEDLGLEPWVKTGIGLETTTLEVGHFIGFPLRSDALLAQGGSFDWTGMTPDDILDSIRELGQTDGEPVRLVAHPRDGILGYFDQYGYDPYTGDVTTPIMSMVNPILKADEFSLGFEALELLNGKRFEIVRSPTQPELDAYATSGDLDSYRLVERTMQEQRDLEEGVYRLGYGHEGQIDDWFSLLNQGVRLTALGNSDTHGKFSIESGCPRNYVAATSDDPARLDAQAIADAVRNHKVVASYGPFVRFWVDDPSQDVGSDVTAQGGAVNLHVEVEAPTWMAVDRVEIYQNGRLIHEFTEPDSGVLRFVEDLPVTLDEDSWFVVIALGDGDLAPVFTPVEIPPIQLTDVVMDALGDVPAVSAFLSPAVPIPRSGVVVPYALTNPIWVDADGDGEWTPPGLPDWLLPPEEPEEK